MFFQNSVCLFAPFLLGFERFQLLSPHCEAISIALGGASHFSSTLLGGFVVFVFWIRSLRWCNWLAIHWTDSAADHPELPRFLRRWKMSVIFLFLKGMMFSLFFLAHLFNVSWCYLIDSNRIHQLMWSNIQQIYRDSGFQVLGSRFGDSRMVSQLFRGCWGGQLIISLKFEWIFDFLPSFYLGVYVFSILFPKCL